MNKEFNFEDLQKELEKMIPQGIKMIQKFPSNIDFEKDFKSIWTDVDKNSNNLAEKINEYLDSALDFAKEGVKAEMHKDEVVKDKKSTHHDFKIKSGKYEEDGFISEIPRLKHAKLYISGADIADKMGVDASQLVIGRIKQNDDSSVELLVAIDSSANVKNYETAIIADGTEILRRQRLFKENDQKCNPSICNKTNDSKESKDPIKTEFYCMQELEKKLKELEKEKDLLWHTYGDGLMQDYSFNSILLNAINRNNEITHDIVALDRVIKLFKDGENK